MNPVPTTYVIRIDGHLDDHWSAWLGELDLTRDDDGSTTLTVSVADQAQLHGVLAGLRDIGAVLTELRTTDAPAPIRPSVLERPLHTERVTLPPATADLDAYRELFSEPARLATAVIVALGHDPAHTGHGYATEAVRALLRYCFRDLGMRRVTANCFLENNTSWCLMERVGRRRKLPAVRESLHRSGRWLDTVG